MKRRLAILLAGASAVAALSAGLVAAQPPSPPAGPQSAPPAPAAPPAPDLPPQEVAPPQPPPDIRREEKPSKPQQPDDGVEAPDDASDKPAAKPDDAAPDPGKRQMHSGAVVQALDKITAETMRFEVRAGQPVRWKGLVFTLRSCETSAPGEPVKDSMAFLQIRSEPHAQSEEAAREVFRGWMFAGAPGLNPLRHPVYDAWLIACRA